MSDFELVEEFLSKKKLDGIDKFLLEKYMGAIRNVLNNSVPKQKIQDKIKDLKLGKCFDWNMGDYTDGRKKESQIEILEKLLKGE